MDEEASPGSTATPCAAAIASSSSPRTGRSAVTWGSPRWRGTSIRTPLVMTPRFQWVMSPKWAPRVVILHVGVAALPHAVLVPDVTEGVDVGHGRAVVDEAQVVHDVAAVPAERALGHEVLRRLEDAAERDGPAGAHEAGGGGALLGGDEVDGADLVVVAPAAPVTPVAVHRGVVGVGGLRGGRRRASDRCCRPCRGGPVPGSLAGQELRRYAECLGLGGRAARGCRHGRGGPGQGGAAPRRPRASGIVVVMKPSPGPPVAPSPGRLRPVSGRAVEC